MTPPVELDQTLIRQHLDAQPYPLVFVTVSGAHLYGFHSPDSDYDLRGMHVTPLREIVRLSPPDETVELMDKSGTTEVDIVTHDIRKYFKLLLGRNGYVLEQVYSPLVVHSTPEFEELRAIAHSAITKHHRHHYRGFAENQWQLVIKNAKPTVKGLLYTYRVLLAGTHLMRTGAVEANLRTLNAHFALSYIDDLIARKIAGSEKQLLGGTELTFHEREFERLRAELESASEKSQLPEEPSCRSALDDLLVRLRMKYQ
ncbi:MAG TPA: nucleotidyltransferase domain-containing protein [Phycisphaerales bacterium]|nr:nucleotidyltransferase domain-containing protein [Phycisphaerales bacterium]